MIFLPIRNWMRNYPTFRKWKISTKADSVKIKKEPKAYKKIQQVDRNRLRSIYLNLQILHLLINSIILRSLLKKVIRHAKTYTHRKYYKILRYPRSKKGIAKYIQRQGTKRVIKIFINTHNLVSISNSTNNSPTNNSLQCTMNKAYLKLPMCLKIFPMIWATKNCNRNRNKKSSRFGR